MWTILIRKHSKLHIFLFYHNKEQKDLQIWAKRHMLH